jgi:hypothetical protein
MRLNLSASLRSWGKSGKGLRAVHNLAEMRAALACCAAPSCTQSRSVLVS